MKDILEQVYSGKKFYRTEAKALLIDIATNEVDDLQVAALLSAFRMRGITSVELSGFRAALQELAVAVSFDDTVIDVCGTGGDGKNTFNISTLAAFVLAGAGVKVAKHGNYGVSSGCGSSNVLEALGVQFQTDEQILREMLAECNICILHAPLFHPALKRFGPIRKAMAVKTFFNLLGPLVNPCKPEVQYSGVFQHEYLRLYADVLEQEQVRYSLVHSLDGYDEISLTGPFKHLSNTKEEQLEPQDLDFPTYKQTDLVGGVTIKESAQIFKNILEGKGTAAQNDVVVVNAAFAYAAYNNVPMESSIKAARSSLSSGAALSALEKLQKFSKECS